MGEELRLLGRRVDGSEFPVEVTSSPMQLATGLLVACTILDLKERQRQRQVLQSTGRRLQEILDNTAAAVYAKDAEGRYLLLNRRYEELFGLTNAQAVGRTDFDIFPREMAEAFRRNDRYVAETGETISIQEVAPHADGPHTYGSVKFPLRDDRGAIYAVAGISTDITELNRSRQEVERLKNRLELILNSVADGICGLDREGKMAFVNRAAEATLAWTSAELLGRPSHELFHHTMMDGQPHPPEQCRISAALLGGDSPEVDDEIIWRRDGTHLPVQFTTAPLRDAGEIVGAVVTFRDMTARKERQHVEDDLKAARACSRGCTRSSRRKWRTSILPVRRFRRRSCAGIISISFPCRPARACWRWAM